MKFTTILLLILLPVLAYAQGGNDPHYKIYDTKHKKVIAVNEIIDDMANADVLFFGEEHNDSTCHVLEFALMKQLAVKYPGKAALSMEMFETDCQTVLN